MGEIHGKKKPVAYQTVARFLAWLSILSTLTDGLQEASVAFIQRVTMAKHGTDRIWSP